MLYNRLQQLGATPILRRGDGNDRHRFGYFGELVGWKEDLWRKYLPFPLSS